MSKTVSKPKTRRPVRPKERRLYRIKFLCQVIIFKKFLKIKPNQTLNNLLNRFKFEERLLKKPNLAVNQKIQKSFLRLKPHLRPTQLI